MAESSLPTTACSRTATPSLPTHPRARPSMKFSCRLPHAPLALSVASSFMSPFPEAGSDAASLLMTRNSCASASPAPDPARPPSNSPASKPPSPNRVSRARRLVWKLLRSPFQHSSLAPSAVRCVRCVRGVPYPFPSGLPALSWSGPPTSNTPSLTEQPRATQRYRGRRRGKDAALAAELRRISAAHPRAGYRMATALLRRAGMEINARRVQRLWRQEGLRVPRRQRKASAAREQRERHAAAERRADGN